MYWKSLAIASMMSLVFLVYIYIMVSAGLAATPDECSLAFNLCMAGCPTHHPQAYNNCAMDCISSYSQCVLSSSPPGSVAPNAASPSNPTVSPPKAQGLREPVGVSGDKQVGGGNKPKDKGVIGDNGNMADKRVVDSGKSRPKAKIGVDQGSDGEIKKLGAGAKFKRTDKARMDTGSFGESKQLSKQWNAPSRSGAANKLQGSSEISKKRR